MLTTPRPRALAPCQQYLAAVDGAHLDCISDAIALLLAHAGVTDVRTPFAVDWRFELAGGDAALPRLDLPPADLDDRLAARTGYQPGWHPLTTVDEVLPRWWEVLETGRPILVVGDAFHLPWQPYAGHQHMDHGFVVEGLRYDTESERMVALLVDPYENTTEWGPAVPQATSLPVADLERGAAGGRWAVLERTGSGAAVDVADEIAGNAAAILTDYRSGALRRFVDAHRALDEPALANLTLQTWLLARNRGLHGRWLADVATELRRLGLAGLPDRFERQVAQAWRRAAQMAYIASRRLRAGRAVAPGCLAAVEQAGQAEADLAEQIGFRAGSREL